MNGMIIYNDLKYYGFNIIYNETKYMFGITKHISFDTIQNGKIVHKEFISSNIELILNKN